MSVLFPFKSLISKMTTINILEINETKVEIILDGAVKSQGSFRVLV